MKVKHLKLENVRLLESAKFDFQPDFNLIIGESGVGKSSALDALRLCLSSIVSRVGKVRSPATIDLSNESRTGVAPQEIECQVRHGSVDYVFSYTKHPEREAVRTFKSLTGVSRHFDRRLKPTDASKVHEREIPNRADYSPLAIHFSTHGASAYKNRNRMTVSNGGIRAAYSRALSNRGMNLGDFGQLLQVKAESDSISFQSKAISEMVENTLARFLPNYKNLDVNGRNQDELFIQNGRDTVPVRDLPADERRIFSIVFDITRRLFLANPGLADPAVEAGAVVLLDEIELHLHPRYQRKFVHDLMEAFPKCQFIATTNSPQVIGEIKPENIYVVEGNKVYAPLYSYGIDSNRVLEEIMDTPSRTEEVSNLLDRISQELNDSRFGQVSESLQSLIEILGEDDPEVTRIQIYLDLVEGE